ncbi:hypothetical protein SLEP1_g7310 [Rubroshorea leprosula]|uniref:U-box domain-containing protein n=1 Tax=Rubroshorea leprosula TaxID=152421 RepID=A0AAV5HY03_9ROSI|nr:hypothetical protein SLEP1_g7310 [Rubroshorea leprosula]
MEEIEVPQYFLCPVSLQIMKDPVTVLTGITYDRESIEQWLKTAKKTTCPVTKQPLPRDTDLTPNHTLLRLIQAWCIANAKYGIDTIPTPKSPLKKSHVLGLIGDLGVDHLCVIAVKKLEALAKENERNRKCMEGAGVAKGMALFMIRCFKEGRVISVLEEALSILHLTWSQSDEIKGLVNENHDFIDSLTWVLRLSEIGSDQVVVKTKALLVLKQVMEVAKTRLLERLKPEFFKEITGFLRKRISQQATKSALQILAEACPWGRNRLKIVEDNTVFQLIELELEKPDKNMSELIFNLLAKLCSCAEGRAQFLSHAGGIAMVSKRILRVSPAVDERGVQILSSISMFSATDEVLLEMLTVAAVTKLCMVIQADCAAHLKERARETLRLHSSVWNDSPCIAVYLLTRYQR